jgi:hypothetical protein
MEEPIGKSYPIEHDVARSRYGPVRPANRFIVCKLRGPVPRAEAEASRLLPAAP